MNCLPDWAVAGKDRRQSRGLGFLIDPDWSPEQALAVFGLVNGLRDPIWSHYEWVLQQKLRDDQVIRHCVDSSEPPF